MEKKVEKELEDVTEDLRDAVKNEKARAVSVGQLQKQSEELGEDIQVFGRESKEASRRIWWKSIKWMLIASSVVLLLGTIVVFMVLNKIKSSSDSDSG